MSPYDPPRDEPEPSRPACEGRDPLGAIFHRHPDAKSWSPDQAIAICQTCPVIEACRANAERLHPTTGVWAGRDYTATDDYSNIGGLR